jgi:hypothetical protein
MKNKKAVLIAGLIVIIAAAGIYFFSRSQQPAPVMTDVTAKLLNIKDYGIVKPTNLHEGMLTFQNVADGSTHSYNLCTSDTDWQSTVKVGDTYNMPSDYYTSAEQSKDIPYRLTIGNDGIILL